MFYDLFSVAARVSKELGWYLRTPFPLFLIPLESTYNINLDKNTCLVYEHKTTEYRITFKSWVVVEQTSLSLAVIHWFLTENEIVLQ